MDTDSENFGWRNNKRNCGSLSARPSIGKYNNDSSNKRQDPIGGEVLLDLNVPAVDFISSVGNDYKFALIRAELGRTHIVVNWLSQAVVKYVVLCLVVGDYYCVEEEHNKRWIHHHVCHNGNNASNSGALCEYNVYVDDGRAEDAKRKNESEEVGDDEESHL